MEFTDEQLYTAIHRLCHFVPVDFNDDFCYAVQEFLVQHAMADRGGVPLQLSDVRDSLKNLFELDFELKEVEIILDRLRKAKKVVYVGESGYRLDSEMCDDLRESIKECEDDEREIIGDWLKSVISKHPELSQDDLQRLEKDLKIFAAKIFMQHGAKCADLIYAEKEKKDEIFKSPEESLSDILPEYPVLDKIRNTELPAFFRDVKGKRKRYIVELLNSSYILHTIQIDTACSMLVKDILKGCLLYLDTNVLYALFGLRAQRDAKAVKRLIKISQEKGYLVAVSTKTMEEFNSSLNFSAKNLKKFPDVPKNLADVGANYSQGGFSIAYWRKHAEIGISPEDFIATYRNSDRLLEEYGIEIRSDFCAEVQEDPELKEQIDLLYHSADPNFIPDNIAEHDAFHRLLIKKLRGEQINKFSDAPAWFLTFDKKLNRYDYIARGMEKNGLSAVPFCISCDDWLQLIRPLSPRSADFDKTFVTLLSSPYFRSYGEVPAQLTEKIISRLTHFKDYSPETAAKILTDAHVIHQLERVNDETEQMKLIDNEIVASAEKFREEKERYKKLFGEEKKTAKRIEEEMEKERSKIVASAEKFREEKELYKKLFGEEKKTAKRIEEEKKRIEEEMEKERSKHLSEKKKYGVNVEKLEKKLDAVVASHETLTKRLKQGSTIAIWLLIASALILAPWNSLELWIKILFVCVAFFSALMALAISRGWKEIYKILAIIGAGAHVVGIITYVVAGHFA